MGIHEPGEARKKLNIMNEFKLNFKNPMSPKHWNKKVNQRIV